MNSEISLIYMNTNNSFNSLTKKIVDKDNS